MLIGAGVGLMSGLFGKGGSAVATPLLHAIGVPALAALASPLPATIPSTLRRGPHILAGRPHRPACAADRRARRRSDDDRRRDPHDVGFRAARSILVADVLVLVLGLRVLLNASHDEDESTADMRTGVAWIIAITGVGRVRLGLARQQRRIPARAAVHHGLRMPVRRALGTSLLALRLHCGARHDRARVARSHRLVAHDRVRRRRRAARGRRAPSSRSACKARSLTLAFGTTLTTAGRWAAVFAR